MPEQTLAFLQIAALAPGVGLLGVYFFAPAFQRWRETRDAAPRWDAPLSQTLLVVWVALAALFLGQFGGALVARLFAAHPEAQTILILLGGLGFHAGALIAVAIYSRRSARLGLPLPPLECPPPLPAARIVRYGIAAALMALPVVVAAQLFSELIVPRLGFSAAKQDLIAILATTESPPVVIGLVLLATVVAPLNEEVLFRAGLYRILRARLPRWVALLGSALGFALLHFNAVSFLPLVVLGVLFALAYDKTGNLFVSVILHGLFNLTTILLIFAGAS